MAKHQTETATLAAQLAAKRNGGNKRRRENQSPPPLPPTTIQNQHKTGFKKRTRTRPQERPSTTILPKRRQKRPALRKRRHKKNKLIHTHNRKRPHHRTHTHVDTCIQSHNICNLSNASLSTHEISLLNKGLSFIPKLKKTNPLKLYSDIRTIICQKTKIKLHFPQ